MLSLYEILKASKTGVAPDMWTRLAAEKMAGSGGKVRELTGIPPLSFRADGTPLLDYLISGNMSQTGTLTPTTPIQPQETGDLETEGAKAGQYKIPILSASTTTPVYLGEVESTRQIKKLVLTGEEEIRKNWADTGNYLFYITVPIGSGTGTEKRCYCTHLPSKNATPIDEIGCSSGNYRTIYINFGADIMSGNNTVAGLKQYLANQYANSTPVTIWYVLATPTTGIVNEPIRKIGDYADTVSMEQAGVQIPTNRGNTVIDVETTLKPSEMYIKYKG